jgi:uncharacterized protein YndB with AHSA1/START domain
MARAANVIVINAPVERVFAYLADGLNNPKWRPGVVKIALAEGAVGTVGAVYQQTLKGPGGRSIAGDYKITTASPPHLLEFAVLTGPARPIGRFELTPTANGGTQVTFGLNYELRGLKKLLMNGLVAATMRTEVANLANLKVQLEQSR